MDLGALLGDILARKIVRDGSAQADEILGKVEITGLTADSRQVEPGFLFAAIAGNKEDGAAYIPDACARGAAAILVAPGVETPADITIPVVENSNPRRMLAEIAARFFVVQPDIMAAVTGTNGKTSVASFLRQIWESAGCSAASIGTLGVSVDNEIWPLDHTTPDPVELHELLRNLVGKGIDHAVLEASSHGLSQHRTDGVTLKAAAFTNISRDHMDYHSDFEDYLAQKMRLFSEVLPVSGIAVVHGADENSKRVLAVAEDRGIKTINVGRNARDIKILDIAREGFGQRVKLDVSGKEMEILLPLVGEFQVENALVAAGLAIACGMEADEAIKALEKLRGPTGRLEHVGKSAAGASIFIDYAHTPDALSTAIEALRPYAAKRVVVVFGAGGDRDRGKRSEMGEAAAKMADIAIVTDDNPRGEDPAGIRAAIMQSIPDAIEIGDRRTAIAAGMRLLRKGDILLIAGKGHEAGQTIGTEVVPFSDHEAVAEVQAEEKQRG
ncbi:MAG: UDP-N-acetylmuramoyl-L-alanyl-D-glutamate--2,6-diaminopimelate ligase [Rhizobiales bacterium]|nr:UDP-N-acetylmuramoyl-L-alanyl-D-glutamate--2,6-diaminopimelate ligase [Hyphomicrobiales bacterium]